MGVLFTVFRINDTTLVLGAVGIIGGYLLFSQKIVSFPSQTATFDFGERPMVSVQLQDQQGGYQSVDMMADSGNDITLINKDVARRLGYQFDASGGAVNVVGISGQPQQFIPRDNVMMKIGDTEPFKSKILIGDVDINLLGRNSMENFQVTFDGRKVLFNQRVCNVCGGV